MEEADRSRRRPGGTSGITQQQQLLMKEVFDALKITPTEEDGRLRMQQMEYLLEEIENFKEKLQGKDGQLEDFMTMTQMEQRQGKASGNGNEKDIQKDTDDTVAIAESFYLSVDEGEGVASISNFPRDFRLNSDEEEEESDESGMLTRSLTRGEEMQLRRMKRAERQRELEGWKAKWEEFEKLRREAKAAQEERESNGGILFFSTSGDVGDAAHIERLESELEQWMHASEQIQKLGEEAVLEVMTENEHLQGQLEELSHRYQAEKQHRKEAEAELNQTKKKLDDLAAVFGRLMNMGKDLARP